MFSTNKPTKYFFNTMLNIKPSKSNKKVATELVKELSKICSFVFKKNIVTTAQEKN